MAFYLTGREQTLAVMPFLALYVFCLLSPHSIGFETKLIDGVWFVLPFSVLAVRRCGETHRTPAGG